MFTSMRLLPVMIFAAALLLSFKLGDLWEGFTDDDGRLNPPVSVATELQAQQAAPQPQAGPAGGANANAGEDNGGGDTQGRAMELAGPEVPPPGSSDPNIFTQSEINLLQSLTVRREELDKRASELEMREGLLEAAEQRIDQKVAELKELKTTIDKLLKDYDKQEKKEMEKLVKIYENMKPKDAARIFNQLDMPVLLGVVGNMREQAAAAIMAEMDPKRAEDVTQELATRRTLPIPTEEDNG